MKVRLYLRVRLPNGKRKYADPVYTASGKVKPLYALVAGMREHHPEGVYHLRYLKAGKRVWENVGANAESAAATRVKQERMFDAVAAGIALAPTAKFHASAEDDGAARRSIKTAIAKYIGETRLTKKPKTLAAYSTALAYFQESLDPLKLDVEDLERMDMLRFHAFLRDVKKQSPRSCANKFSNVMSFLKMQRIREIVKTGDWPSYVEEEPEIYEPEELGRFFAACTSKERGWFQFFLMTGMREQEVMYCSWRNVNFVQGTVAVRWKPEFNWTPKAYKEREIPVPAPLLDALISIRPTLDRGELIFRTCGGRPKMDFLDRCKAIAKRAGFDPSNWWLHKFRATFGTMHLQAGVDLRTVQKWLGHVDLESTLRYLKPARGAEVQRKVNETFAQMG